MSDQTIEQGTRSSDDEQMRRIYLETGKVPMGTAVRKGLLSLLRDPYLMFIQYLPGPIGFVARQRYYRRRLGRMGKGVVLDPDVHISTPQHVYLDDFCYLGKGTQLNAPEGYIKIGKRCHVVGWILGHGGVEIGDYVASAGTILSATSSHQGGYRMSGPMIPPEQRDYRKGKVVIGKDAFLATYSMVMPGVTIGEGAVVAPHSLVTSDVAPWTVVMGSPARAIGKREPVRFPDPD